MLCAVHCFADAFMQLYVFLSQCMTGSKEKQEYIVVKAQLPVYLSYSSLYLSMHFTRKAVYLTQANMHNNHLLAHSNCHYCKQEL